MSKKQRRKASPFKKTCDICNWVGSETYFLPDSSICKYCERKEDEHIRILRNSEAVERAKEERDGDEDRNSQPLFP